MKFNKNLLAVAITTVTALSLYGCGTDKQDGGKGSSNAVIGSGIAVDGPIVRAQVFYDLNGNKKKDSYEPGALTDNEGNYNYNSVKRLDYCSGASARTEYCLTLTTAQQQALTADTKIIVTGGYDLYTGEPFEGSLSFPAKSSNGSSQFVAITPLTSLLEADPSSGFILEILSLLPASFDYDKLLNLNFLESEANFAPEAFAVTYQMHKFVTIISDWVENHYDDIDDGEDIQSDISSLIYLQFTDLNSGLYQAAWDKLVVDINALYDDAELHREDAPSQSDVNELIANLTAVNDATKVAFGNSLGTDPSFTFANHKARIRGVEVVVSKILQGQNPANAIAALSDNVYLEHLAGDEDGNLNFTKVLEEDGSTAELIDAAAAAKDTSDSSLASDLAGKTLTFEDDNSDPDLDAKAVIFFTGEEGATRGDIHLCLKYQEVGEEDQALPGDYISGSWETLASLNNTVMLRLNYLGGRSAVLKKIGKTGNENEAEYRFDFNGEASNFTGENELDAITEDATVISSQAACTTWVNENTAAEEEEPNSVLLPLN